MSIVFKPKIPDQFIAPSGIQKMQKSYKTPLEMDEIDLLVKLRALKVSFEECGRIMKREPGHCSGTVHRLQLYQTINTRRQILINKEMK